MAERVRNANRAHAWNMIISIYIVVIGREACKLNQNKNVQRLEAVESKVRILMIIPLLEFCQHLHTVGGVSFLVEGISVKKYDYSLDCFLTKCNKTKTKVIKVEPG